MAGDGIGHAAKCFRYGSFMRDLRRWQVELIFFGCFGFVILELIIAGLAWVHSEAIVKQIREAEKEVERGCVHEDLDQRKHVLRKRQYKTVAITSVCAVLGVVATVMEAFAILAHEYCDGEDLTQFYWAFWSLISVGACIALIGLAIYHIYSLNDKDHPPWMIALGTPVLVLAGLGHLLVLAILALLRRFLGWQETRPQELARRRSSPASTIPLRGNAYGAYVLGFNASGEPLIRFPNNANRPVAPIGSELLHFDPVTGAATVRYPSLRNIQDPENLGAARYTTPESLVTKQEESVQEQLDSLSSSSSGVVSPKP